MENHIEKDFVRKFNERKPIFKTSDKTSDKFQSQLSKIVLRESNFPSS